MERSSSGQEPTRLPRWEEVAWRESSEQQADIVLCAGAAAHGDWNVTQFHCLKFRLGSASEPNVWSHCYSVPYMKIPANNQVIFFGLDLEKKSTVLDGFFPYLAQMITSMGGCVAYNDLWPWPISSRSFGLGLENGVCSVASPVLDGFFPYLVQMITSTRRCVACDDLWPWPISSRSFDLDFENRVRSVTFSVLNRFFPYLPQIITTIRGCVACEVYNKILKFKFFTNFLIFQLSPWQKSTILLAFFPYLAQIIISIRGCVVSNDLWPWPIFSRSFSLDLENHVHSVASTVLDGFFPYLVQMITSMRCVACDDLWPWPISSRSFLGTIFSGQQHTPIDFQS